MKFAIIDIETTGGSAKTDKITEVGIVLTDGKKILDQYSTLVNPERNIPPFITKITGISNKMVKKAPKFYEIAGEIVRMTEGAVFVAHNVRFDYSFIKEEFRQLGYTFSKRQLCTVRLSRKTFPELSSHSLENLIRHFKIKVENRHRALDDALATTELFHKMLRLQKSAEAVKNTVNMGIKDSAIPEHLDLDIIAKLPQRCGVYRFLDKQKKPIYIGKSKNIQSRILQHFRNGNSKGKWLQKRAFHITYEITGSELVALLLENDEIKQYRPELNIAQKHTHFPYAIYTHFSGEGYIKFFIGKHPLKSKRSIRMLRLFTSQRNAKNYMNHIVEKHELCAKLCGLDRSSLHCFRYDIRACHGACIQAEPVKSYNLRARAAKEKITAYFEEDFYILDQGREEQEEAIVCINNGVCSGWAFRQNGQENKKPETLESFTPLEYPIGTHALIQQFLKSSLSARILPSPTVK